jgi:hypothetical protein
MHTISRGRKQSVDINKKSQKYLKKFLIVLCIAAVHFVVTKMVTMITFSVFAANADETRISSVGHLLMMISRVLYFPVMTMAWYPRRFFPGNLIVIPLLINSLIWAIGIYMIFVLIKRLVPTMGKKVRR